MSEATFKRSTSKFELDFEKPLLQLERQIHELESQSAGHGAQPGSAIHQRVDIQDEVEMLKSNHQSMLKKTYANLSAWDIVKVARHPDRPQTEDYINAIVRDYCELHGDRAYGDDPALTTGFGRIGPHKVMFIGHNKGKDTKQRVQNHFGMAHPEGYRKALLKMKLAEKFGLPVITLIDTPGAYPGIGAEERGQAQAIAINLLEMARLKTPIISIVIGEGGSGGALGIGVGDRIAMMQYAWYSVISPEGCAAILWKSGEHAPKAAEALKITAEANMSLGTIDKIIDEPLGGGHRDPETLFKSTEQWIIQTLRELKRFKPQNLAAKRYDRIRQLGAVR